MKKVLKIGITGGIGSGKSCVAAYFKDKGYPVFSCDKINNDLLNDKEYIDKIAKIFPNCVTDNMVDKITLAKEIFSATEKRKRLEEIAHPEILNKLFKNMDECNTTSFAEVPLLLENNLRNKFDKIIVVIRDKNNRIKSSMERDGLSEREIERKIAAQYPYDESLKKGTFNDKKFYLIFNDSSKEELYAQLDKLNF